MDPKYIARIAHEADRTLAAINGDMTVGGWNNLHGWERTSAIAGVKHAIALPEASAATLHQLWINDKAEAGWMRGATFSLTDKKDPLLLPWNRLTPLQRLREEMFLAVVRSLSPTV